MKGWLLFMKKKMKLTITFDENSDAYSVSTDFDGMDLEAFLGGVATVLVDYGIGSDELPISPADVGFLLTTHIMEEALEVEAE